MDTPAANVLKLELKSLFAKQHPFDRYFCQVFKPI